MTDRIIMFSAGGGSWAAGKRVIERHGPENVRLLFADTLYEDADSYRFLIEGAANILERQLNWSVPRAEDFPDYRANFDTAIEDYCGNPVWRAALANLRTRTKMAIPELIWIAEGRDPWEVYRDERLLGNSRVDPCSRVLKRQMADRWLRANFDPASTIVYVGIDWTEKHRFDDGEGGGLRPRRASAGWTYEAPLCEPPWIWKPGIPGEMRALGITPPRQYGKGYSHNNCGGFCCKAGHAHYANRLRVDADRFAYDESMEAKLIAFLDHPYSILTTRVGGNGKQTMTLAAFRRTLEARPEQAYLFDDWGGCGCFVDDAIMAEPDVNAPQVQEGGEP